MRAAVLLLALAFAGCTALPEAIPASAFAFDRYLVAPEGNEPTVGVTSDGAIFVGGGRAPRDETPRPTSNVGAEAVYRSTDGGATWENVLANAPDRSPADFDPWVWVDPLTDRVFNAPLYLPCAWISWSDDRGESWTSNPAGGCGTPGHDHQHLSTGPPAAGVTTSGYPNVVYYAYASLRPGTDPVINQTNPIFGSNVYEGTAVSVSLDGGATFAPHAIARPQDPCAGANDGPVAVAPDGTAYVPMPSCQGVDIAVSEDSGATWGRMASVTGTGSQLGIAMDPILGVDAAGIVHLAYVGADDIAYHATSRDQGRTWSIPSRVQPPEVLAAVFPALVVSPEGAVTIAYHGTSSDPTTWPTFDPSEAPDDAVWHLYVSRLANGNGTFTTTRVTPDHDPVQRGCVWLRGGSEPCRNMGDFFGLALTPDARAVVAYIDGCDRCASADESRLTNVVVAIEREAENST